MSTSDKETGSVTSDQEAQEMVCEAFEELKKREDKAFDVYTSKIQREKQQQEFLLNEKLKDRVYAQIRKEKTEKRELAKAKRKQTERDNFNQRQR